MTPLPDTFEARLAAVQCRADAVTREDLERDGWTIASEPTPWLSVWMTRPVRDEEPRK